MNKPGPHQAEYMWSHNCTCENGFNHRISLEEHLIRLQITTQTIKEIKQ